MQLRTIAGWRIRCAVTLVSVISTVLGLGVMASPALAADGTGAMSVSPTYVVSGSTGNYLDFTYTASGTVTNGQITLLVPTGWPTPSPSGFDANGLSDQCEGDGNLPTVTAVAGGSLITTNGVNLGNGNTCEIKYGIPNFNSGVTAPVTTGAYQFTTQEKSTSGGTLTDISGQPSVNVGNDGTGTMTVSPTHVTSSSTGNTLTFTYTATRTNTNGKLTVSVPTGWSSPSTTASAAGAITSTCGTVGASGSGSGGTITISGVNLAASGTCTVTYGNKTSGPGVTAPASGGFTPATFTTQHEATNDNNLIALASSPTVSVTDQDGSGTMVVSPTKTVQNSTGNEFDFTYTAPAGGLSNGQVALLVPTGWPQPSPSGFDANGISDQCEGDGNLPTVTTVSGGYLITSNGVSLSGGSTCLIKYGINGFNAGVTAPSTQGLYTFTTQTSTWSGGTLTNISSSPTIQVGNSGTGTLVVAPTHAYAGSTGNTLTFTYTAANAISSGQLTIAVPTGWSPPSTSSAAPGATTSTCGTVGINVRTIQITGMNLSTNGTCTVTYGDKAGGAGATAPSTGGLAPETFSAQEQSDSSGTLTDLSTGSPSVTVTALDGAGTMNASPSTVITSSTGNEFDFTYTAPPGGLSNGQITLLVPTNWPTPDPSGFNPNGLSDQCEGDGNPPTVTAVAGGHLITTSGVSLNGGATCQIKYGINGFNSGVTAPSQNGPYTFTTQTKTWSSGTLANVGTSPVITVGNDGTGTMTVAPTSAVAGSTGNTLTFTYTAATTVSNGELTVAVPASWSPPSTTGSAAGFTTSTCGTVGVSGSTIQVTGVSRSAAQTCTITYGSEASGGPGATADSSGGPTGDQFTTQEQSSSGGTLTTLGSGSPVVTLHASDGAGSMTVSPNTAINNSTGNDFDFTYIAPVGGVVNGTLTVLVPTGWTTPTTTTGNAGGITSTCTNGTITISSVGGGSLITIPGVSLNGGSSCDLNYGLHNFNPGVTAPAGSGAYVFTTQEASSSGGTLTTVNGSPAIDVSTDGSGTLTVAPTAVSAGATGTTLTFTYTSGVSLSNGEVTVDIPAGWPAPSTTGTDPGFTTTDCNGASVSVFGTTIHVSGITMGAATGCSIDYGATTSGGPGATVTSTTGASQFAGKERSSSTGSLTDLAASPQLTVYGSDGSGSMAVAPVFTAASSGGNTLTFTYTAASGGLNGGQLTVAVPTGWSAPSTTPQVDGYATSTCGNVSIVSGAIHVASVNLGSAGTCTITYGNRSSGGAGATAPSSPGEQTFSAQERSTASGTVTDLASSPQVDVTSADGSGTMSVSPVNASTGSSGNTLAFTFTAAAGGTHDGEIDLAVPNGWSPPSTTSSDAGSTTSDCGTVGVSSTTITVTGVTLAGGGTCTITYGSKAGGGSGAAAPSSDTTSTFSTSEASTALGVLTSIASSPSVSVLSDGSGSLTVSPLTASAVATGQTLTFDYTAGAPLHSGEVSVAIPSGWSPPSTTGSDPGFTTTDCSGGTVSVVGQTVHVSGITIGASTGCSITYGATGSGGPGATVTSSLGDSVFGAQERSFAGGTLTDLATSPKVTVYAADGSGTMTVAPAVIGAGSSGKTFTFTYTAAAGGINNGQLVLPISADWSAPSTSPPSAGNTTSTCGTVSITNLAIHVSGVSLGAGGTCTITYGDKSSGGAGATVGSSPGSVTFTAQEASTGTGNPTALATSPEVQITSADGAGTLTASPTKATTGSSGNTLTFTFTAASGGTHDGEIEVAVPAGWSAPSTTASDAGSTSSACGTVGVTGTTIQVTGVTLAGGSSCMIVYGSKAGGGPGATAPSSSGSSTFTATDATTDSGVLTALASSPSVTTAPLRKLTVTVKGKGHVSGNGISCPGTCSKSYVDGTAVSLSAHPASGFRFSGWSGACTGAGACHVTLSSNKAVTATFKAIPVCIVPRVKGDTLSKAERLIKAAHCAVGKVTRPAHSAGQKLVVGSTTPPAGTRRPKGTKVAITMVRKK